MGKTSIEWTEYSLNPVRARNRTTGKLGWFCVHESDGCKHCYSEAFNRRLGTGIDYRAQDADKVELFLDQEILTQPLRWRTPRRIFWGSMTDLFAPFIPDEWLDKCLAVCALTPQHQHLFLTKRAERMRDYLTSRAGLGGNIGGMAVEIMEQFTATVSGGITTTYPIKAAAFRDQAIDRMHGGLSNLWAGVSIEDQPRADKRIPLLLETPAAVRWISYEPALAGIRILDSLMSGIDPGKCANCGKGHGFTRCPNYGGIAKTREENGCRDFKRQNFAIHWVVAGGESGPGARPMHPEWARSIRDQCLAAGVPFFFKQHGEFLEVDGPRCRALNPERAATGYWLEMDGKLIARSASADFSRSPYGTSIVSRVGKKEAGRLLDGREWNEYPAQERA